MKIIFLLLLFTFAAITTEGQNISQLAVTSGENKELIPAIYYNNTTYFSLIHLAEAISARYTVNNASGQIEMNLGRSTLVFTALNPYLVIRKTGDTDQEVVQLPVTPYLYEQHLYAPLEYSVHYINSSAGRKLLKNEGDKIYLNEIPVYAEEKFPDASATQFDITSVTTEESNSGLLLKFISEKKIQTYISSFDGLSLTLLFRGVRVDPELKVLTNTEKYLSGLSVKETAEGSEIRINLSEKFSRSEVVKVSGSDNVIVRLDISEDQDWYEKQSQHFKVIYKAQHSYLTDHVLSAAERSLALLNNLFGYKTSERIIIALFDIHDYGFGAATTTPQNIIRLEIEPMETGYESLIYNDRFTWLISHELVHIAVNDNAAGVEKFLRSVFSKVAPEQNQPLTVPFSIITNKLRYAPRWYQESIAVYLETWMSGGYGRSLASFDEMYFRSLIIEGRNFPKALEIESSLAQTNFLLDNNHYLYGTRFATYLAVNYGHEKLFKWFTPESGGIFSGIKSRFSNVYGFSFSDSWKNFSEYETTFQRNNILRLKRGLNTSSRVIVNEPFGWITQPFYDRHDSTIIFGSHKPHNLALLKQLNLRTFSTQKLVTLPTPSLLNIASLAFDENTGLIFYTTNNNEFYRDLWVFEKSSGNTKLLFEDARVGHITVSPVTHELWGVQHFGGKSSLVYSSYPYNSIEHVVGFDIGDELHQLSVNPSGNLIAAVLQRSNGLRSLILIDCNSLKAGDSFRFETISQSGSPENPSWSYDGSELYWNAYTNGVSNIYRLRMSDRVTDPVTHTLKGLFKPVYLSSDYIFAFEFTTDGFVPVIVQNKPAKRLPALEYMGQRVVETNPEVLKFLLENEEVPAATSFGSSTVYSGISNLNINTFIPVVSGFLSGKVLGFYARVADPLLNHDFTIEAGVSPFRENRQKVRAHVKAKYDFKKNYEFGLSYNAPDFYDLFNSRKKSMLGEKYHIAYNNYWVYDNPLKIKQRTEIAFYRKIEFFLDNVVSVSEPDFLVAQTNLNSKNVRRSIGSVDAESGNEFNFSILFFGANPKDPQYSAQFYGEWDNYNLWLWPHNVFHFKLMGGYHLKNENLYQAKFFFGGFGNRELEHVFVKQYRNLFRFPGVPIYSIAADEFASLLIENSFPPLNIKNFGLGSHFLDNVNLSVFSKGLITNFRSNEKFINAGGQINFVFKHFYNLETTFSAGVARAWYNRQKSDEWFLSFKLLKN